MYYFGSKINPRPISSGKPQYFANIPQHIGVVKTDTTTFSTIDHLLYII
jgi:hypothetical protein